LTPPKITNNLAELRNKRGLSAARLAEAVRITRQAVYAIEADTYVPNTLVTLRIAQVLSVSVEEIFRIPRKPAVADVEFLDPDIRPGMPVQVARVQDRLIAVRPAPPECYLPSMDTTVKPERQIDVHSLELDNRIAIAGCDPAGSIVAYHLRTAGLEPVFIHRNSAESIGLLKQSRVHVAGTHLRGKTARARQFTVIAFAHWQEGLIVAHRNPKRIKTIEDLARKNVRFVNREAGAGTRQLLDAELARLHMTPRQVRGYNHEARGHLAAAREVYAGAADCCIATEAAARAFGLDFIPLDTARYDFVLRRADMDTPIVRSLLNVLHSGQLRRALSRTAGYDTSLAGQQLT
jgi:molybdate-binding protein/DNA-binding XRE family transcriptional regulator